MGNFDIASKTSYLSNQNIFNVKILYGSYGWWYLSAVYFSSLGLVFFQLISLPTVSSHNAQSPREQVYDASWESDFALKRLSAEEKWTAKNQW